MRREIPIPWTARAQHLCNVSYDEEMAFVAVTGSWEHEEVVGNACYYVNPATRLADVASRGAVISRPRP